ncbi:MAG: hypothetical protein MK013_01330 [Dehalococcoidia bacterium]|nr:hypothetical protein [Dehalococcoidia bacterium]|tara:strand:- start:3016 stop:3672 length:657 start_codon:yes stop_codon:yes gene_type:complete
MSTLFITNRKLKKLFNDKSLNILFIENENDFSKLEEEIKKDNPEKIISVDFAVQLSEKINNGSIVVTRETISMNAKPVNWDIPREDRWIETSEKINKSICDILEKLSFEHYVGSGVQLEDSSVVKGKKKAKEWINKNISGIYIDNYSSKLNEVLSSTKVNHSIIRIINSKFPIKESVEKSIIQKIKIFFIEFYFYNFRAKNIKQYIIEKKLFSEISKD